MANEVAKLIYKGLKANLPENRNAGSAYFVTDRREIYFGADLYTDAVRFYTGDKPTTPAQGVLYVNEASGAGDVWNGTAWVNVIKGYITAIDENADHTTVPTTKAAKDYIDKKVADVVAGEVGTLGDLASKDRVTEDELAEALKTKIDGKADQTTVDTLIGDDTGKSARTIANEELAKQLIPENAAESLDTLTEIAAWIQSHPDDASAMNTAIDALKTKVTLGTHEVDGEQVEYATVKAYVEAAIAALEIGDYAKAADLTALADRVTTLETDTHTHTNQTELDKFADGDKAKWDAAETKAHEHTNKTELDGITAAKITSWDKAVEAITVGTF